MRIGIPKELHDGERRVATTPEVAAQLQKLGFTVAVETGAGAAANFTDDAYAAAGGTIVLVAITLRALLSLRARAGADRGVGRRAHRPLPLRRPARRPHRGHDFFQ